MFKITVSSSSFSRHPTLRAELLDCFPGAVFNDTVDRPSAEQTVRMLAGAEGAIVGLEPVGSVLLRGCPSLRVVSKYGVGLDNVDLAACRRKGVAVLCTPGVNRLAVAEIALGLMLGMLRDIPGACARLKSGLWTKPSGRQLSGMTVGVIGLGRIGQEVVRLLQPFNCRILGNDIVDRSAFCRRYGVQHATKDRIFRDCDIITMHVPLTRLTQGLIGRRTLARMKPDALVVNTARGGIVDQAALKAALHQKRIAGAALDVFAVEPETDREFLSLPNLVCTPHRAGSTRDSVLAMGRAAISNLRDFLSGKKIPDEIRAA